MTRIIKRYGSRKLYDTTESRYVLLEDIAEWIRKGEDISVVDNKTSEDVTAQTLTQVISEEGRKKSSFLSSELLHDLIRAGESAVNNRVRQFQEGMESLVKRGFDKLMPVSAVRDEMTQLRRRLEELEEAVSQAEDLQEKAAVEEEKKPEQGGTGKKAEKPAARKPAARKPATRKPAAKKAGTASKPAAKKTTTASKPAAKKTVPASKPAAKKTAMTETPAPKPAAKKTTPTETPAAKTPAPQTAAEKTKAQPSA
ncbi:MAG: polyhydroxyalkanoate synthesis regulator DNA-binding domain-containing protein [Acidobacteriota bacterium]|nr:polyhydroxyalkanoate synthesis regulator DNA-binding domain-containing protein [Acidobacteriota bacterium]